MHDSMKRKVIKQGNNTLTVTLPRSWTGKFGVGPGEEIEMVEEDRGLLITTSKALPARRADISINGMTNPMVWRHVMGAYRAGYDEIMLRFSNPERKYAMEFTSTSDLKSKYNGTLPEMSTIHMIQETINRFIGMEIIEQHGTSCLVKDITNIDGTEFDGALRRIFYLVEASGEFALKALKDGRVEGAYETEVNDNSVDRFSDYCMRILNKVGYSSYRKTPVMYTIVSLLEFVGDEYKRLAGHVKEKAVGKELLDLGREVQAQFHRFHEFFYRFSTERLLELNNEDKRLKGELDKAAERASAGERELVHHLKKVRRLIVDLIQFRIELEV